VVTGEFDEASGEPGTAFKHEQVPGAVPFFEFPGLCRSWFLDQDQYPARPWLAGRGTGNEDSPAGGQAGVIPADEHGDLARGGAAQKGQRAWPTVEIVGERDVEVGSGPEVVGAVKDGRQVSVGTALRDEADRYAWRDDRCHIATGRVRVAGVVVLAKWVTP
jgi:hypothetical protein